MKEFTRLVYASPEQEERPHEPLERRITLTPGQEFRVDLILP